MRRRNLAQPGVRRAGRRSDTSRSLLCQALCRRYPSRSTRSPRPPAPGHPGLRWRTGRSPAPRAGPPPALGARCRGANSTCLMW